MPSTIEALAPQYRSQNGFSLRLDRIRFVRTEQAVMAPGDRARLQFGLAQRKPPLLAEDPYRGWRQIGRVIFATPNCTVNLLVPGGVYETLEVSYPERMLRDVGVWTGDAGSLKPQSLSLNNRSIENDLARIVQELRAPSGGHGSYFDSLGIVILHEIARTLSNRTRCPPHPRGGLPPWRQRIIAARMASETEPLPDICELAALCGLSSRHLMRAFRQETGETLGAAIRRIALDRARAWLADDNRAIGQIAADLGFSSAASLAVAFRREVGMLPSDFRAAQQAAARSCPYRTDEPGRISGHEPERLTGSASPGACAIPTRRGQS